MFGIRKEILRFCGKHLYLEGEYLDKKLEFRWESLGKNS